MTARPSTRSAGSAPLAAFQNPKIGPVALSDQAATYPVADFDWIRFNPDEPIGGGGGGSFVDDFDGADLGAGWDVVRRDQQLTVSGGKLNIPAQPGDIYGGRNDAKNLVHARRAGRPVGRDRQGRIPRAARSTTRPACSCTATTRTSRSWGA